MADIAKEAGYATACIGKWHLGFGTQEPTDWNAELTPGPLELGFDYYFGVPVVNSHPPFVYVENYRVVGLVPGDPFVFGRGGEEALALRAAGVDFEVVPGITSSVAAPAAAIRITHRESPECTARDSAKPSPSRRANEPIAAAATVGESSCSSARSVAISRSCPP